MALKREDYLTTITEGIAWLAMLCKIRGVLHLFDANTISHEFFCRVLNEIHDLNLVVMDRIHPNFPAIDLGDGTNKRSFQITAEYKSDKIQTTLNTYSKHDLISTYGKIQIVIIGEKQSSYNSLRVPSELAFTPSDDIIDTNGLIKIIEGLGTDKLERIAKLVSEEIKIAIFPKNLCLHVSAHNDDDIWRTGGDTTLSYIARPAGDEIGVQPFMPYLTKMAAGGPIEPLSYVTTTWCPFEWNRPALDFKMLNRTSVPFLLAEAIFDVEESRLDDRAVIVVKKRRVCS